MYFSKFSFTLCLISCFAIASSIEVTYDGRALKIDGKRRILVSGSIHYPRSTPEMWPDLIKKSKEGGLDVIETYVFWNAHEPHRRQYDFSGNLDLVGFIKAVQKEGLYLNLRIGPYVCAEWNYGGFPLWLHTIPGIELRTYNSLYMNEMQNFTTYIVDMLKKEKLFAPQGGNIILAQIENEYGNFISSYGDNGKTYIKWCAEMAVAQDIGVPWIMCQQSDAPYPMINTCNGYYCDQFKPNNNSVPKIWTENWSGWFQSWGSPSPLRTAEDLAFSVARFYQLGGTFQNYYMYHGGTNFGRTAGGPYITTTYDYNAPLNEYGGLNQPKYGHLKQLHDLLHSMENILTNGNVSNHDFGHQVTSTIYNTTDGASCFLANVDSKSDANITFLGTNYTVPAWSVSVLPDCKKDVYNTARVNTQTSIMVKKGDKKGHGLGPFKWSWRPEMLNRTLVEGVGEYHSHRLIDQKRAEDQSDYLWYMAKLNLDSEDPILMGENMRLRINGTGQVLHAYLNGNYLGSNWAAYDVFHTTLEVPIKLTIGENLLSLLSATVGFKNYGAYFDLIEAGIVSPVEVISTVGDNTIIKDLSSYKWTYNVGLHGMRNAFYVATDSEWKSDSVPVFRNMTWYRTTFKTPDGTDPVVVDLLGLGKGEAWVNGNSLGRYWPSFIADPAACSDAVCDYRGSYYGSKCNYDCGKPTQRWYHVPRSFLKSGGDNTLVLFEEFGGSPKSVSFKTVRPGTVCGHAYEGNTLELSCEGKPISDVSFASFGNPTGKCGAFEKGKCKGEKDVISIIEKDCVGKETCSIEVSEDKFGTCDCGDEVKRLAVEVTCEC